jgi:hypothetical protein
MKKTALLLAFFALLLVASPAFSDDQQKAQKEINKITAMATDFDGRRVVNLSMAEMFKVPRPSLVAQRGQTGLNYGNLFLVQELEQSGVTPADIATKLNSGSKISDIANQQHIDWKRVGEDGKKLNAAIDQNLYNFFLGKKLTAAQDSADKYDVHYDGVKADSDIGKQEIASAQDRYLLWKDRAAKAHADGKRMSYGDERIADMDHVAGGGPQGGGRGSSGTAGTQGPDAMGGPR